jgi:hypothetical protein
MNLADAVRQATSMAAALRLLGRANVGTNYRSVRREIERLGLDTSHWEGGGGHRPPIIVTSAELLVANNPRPRRLVKKVILREKLLPHVCEMCGLGPEWNGRPLVLRLDHKNGVRNDDRLENLRFLCPNCDSQTETYCGRNRFGEGETSVRKRPCSICQVNFTFKRRCRSCASKDKHRLDPQPTKIVWPPIEELQARLANSSFAALASELGVSDNAIRKHLRTHARVAEGGGF